MALLMAARLLSVLALHLRSRPNGDATYRLLHPGAKAGQAFTFGTNVYFSIDVPDDADFDQALAHEQVHARQLHTIDVLLTELFICVFWFHPGAWWMRSQVRANLEYLVDAAVIGRGHNRRAYQLALVRQSQGAQALALALPFSEPSLRSRISRLTGLPHHWAVATVASLGMAFWLAVSGLIVFGTANDGVVYTDEEPYVAYFEDKLPEEIYSFNIYGRRVLTVDEYYQIRAILQRIPGAGIHVYKTEEHPEDFQIRIEMDGAHADLSAGVPQSLSTTQSYRVGLTSLVPPHKTWITPMTEVKYYGTPSAIHAEVSQSPFSGRMPEKTYTIALESKSWTSTPDDLVNHMPLFDEGLTVKVNGKPVKLRPSILVDAMNGDGQYYQLDNGYVAPAEWSTETLQYPRKTKSEIFNGGEVEVQIALGKRVERLMNCEDGCPRSMSFTSYNGNSFRAFYENQDFVDFIEKRAFYNGNPVDLDLLLDTDYGPGSYFTTGWSTESDPNVIILEVVDKILPEMRPGLSDEVLREAFNAMYQASQNQ